MKFVIRINPHSLCSAVHDPACRVVVRKQPGFVYVEVEAEGAYLAAAEFDISEESYQRGLEPTRVCDCALA